jgi:hypothetical protein
VVITIWAISNADLAYDLAIIEKWQTHKRVKRRMTGWYSAGPVIFGWIIRYDSYPM